jgi:hypothetical protein
MFDPYPECPLYADRKTAILDAVADAGEATHFVPSEIGYLEAPIVKIDQKYLVYRANNGRVLSELTSAALTRKKTLDDLKALADTAEIQHILHELLIKKSRDPKGPIYAELERHALQTDPLLIQENGVVLNGNRRLAAMRDLMSREGENYKQFTHVRVAVLPENISDNEIEFIEAALQMAPDLKLDYGWINRRLKLRQHVDSLGDERVVEAYGFQKADAIDRELGELMLAEEYLEWIGQPLQFSLVDAQEDAFNALVLMQIDMQFKFHLFDIWKRLGFAMIKARDELDRKIMHYFPFTDPIPPQIRNWVPRSLAEDRGIVERQPLGENRALESAGADRLIPLLNEVNQARNTALSAMALIDTLKGSQKRLVGFSELMTNLRRTTQVLGQIKIEDLSDDQRRQIRAQLAAHQEHLATL